MKGKINLFFSAIILSFLISSCVYTNKFSSEPAEGLYNMPMHEVDAMITADLLEEFIESKNNLKKKMNPRLNKNIKIR